MMTQCLVSKDEFEQISIDQISPRDRYKLFMGSVIPRPIAFVSSLNDQGKINLAPFSNFMVISSSSGLLAFSVGSEVVAESRIKDTLRNIRKHGEFVINLASDSIAAQVQTCSGNYPPEVSEAEMAGFTSLPSSLIKTPRIAECKIQFECRLEEIRTYGRSNLIVGQVVLMHAIKGLVRQYTIDPVDYAPLARIGGRMYCKLGELIMV